MGIRGVCSVLLYLIGGIGLVGCFVIGFFFSGCSSFLAWGVCVDACIFFIVLPMLLGYYLCFMVLCIFGGVRCPGGWGAYEGWLGGCPRL